MTQEAPKIAVFVPSYGITRLLRMLTDMNFMATKEGAEIAIKLRAEYVIVSACFATWQHEARLKIAMLEGLGVDTTLIRTLAQATSTYDEAKKLKEMLERLGVTMVIIVGDRWQVPRAAEALRKEAPSITILTVPVVTPRFERIDSPSFIRSLPVSREWLWAPYNFLLSYFALLLRR